MLRSFLIDLEALRPASLPPWTGYQAYGLTLALIAARAPELARRVHGDSAAKPLTVSCLLPGASRAPTRAVANVVPGESVCIRVASLREDVFDAIADAVAARDPSQTVDLGGAEMKLAGLRAAPAQSPMCATSSFEALLGDADPRASELPLWFLSPTAFRTRGNRNSLLPEPAHVFGSLQARWNAFAPRSLRTDIARDLIESLEIGAHRINTVILDFGRYQERGFVGRVDYRIPASMASGARVRIQALAAFSRFAGIGAKTTMGMGQAAARRVRGGGRAGPEPGDASSRGRR